MKKITLLILAVFVSVFNAMAANEEPTFTNLFEGSLDMGDMTESIELAYDFKANAHAGDYISVKYAMPDGARGEGNVQNLGKGRLDLVSGAGDVLASLEELTGDPDCVFFTIDDDLLAKLQAADKVLLKGKKVIVKEVLFAAFPAEGDMKEFTLFSGSQDMGDMTEAILLDYDFAKSKVSEFILVQYSMIANARGENGLQSMGKGSLVIVNEKGEVLASKERLIGDPESEIFILDEDLLAKLQAAEKVYLKGKKVVVTKVLYYAFSQQEEVDKLVEVPATATIETNWALNGTYMSYTTEGWTSYNIQDYTQVAFDGNDIYVKGIAMWFPEAWLKGTIQGNKVVFASGQFVGEDEYGPEYIIATVDGENVAPEFTFDYNAETKTLTLGEYLVVESAKKDEIYAYGYWQGLTIYQGEIIVPEPVVVPDGLETEVYTFSAQELQFDEQDNPVYEPISFDVNVGFNGNDVYVQGMAQKASFEYLTDAWVKGTMQDGVATFATGQFFGTVMDQYNFFFLGYGEEGIQDLTMSYANDTFTTDDWIIINAYQDKISYYAVYTDVKMTKKGGDGIQTLASDGAEVRYFDAQGRQTTKATKGLLLKQVRMADGSVKTVKMMNK